jgi:hypothetical protein
MPTLKGYRLAGNQSGSVELSEDKLINRYSLEYLVIADNTSQGQLTIQLTSGLPRVGISSYSYHGESHPEALCKRKSAKRDTRNPLLWIVTCDFDNDPNSQSEDDEDTSTPATSKPAVVKWTSEYGEEVLHQDFSSPRKDIITPAGNAYDPPITRKIIYPVCTLTRYQSAFTPATILAYEDHVNSGSFLGAPAEHALMASIVADRVIEDGVMLWQVTYRVRFAVQEHGFRLMPLNQDYRYKESSGSTTWTNTPNGQLVNLNADGTKAADGTRTFGGEDEEGFLPYPTANFNDLSLA